MCVCVQTHLVCADGKSYVNESLKCHEREREREREGEVQTHIVCADGKSNFIVSRMNSGVSRTSS